MDKTRTSTKTRFVVTALGQYTLTHRTCGTGFFKQKWHRSTHPPFLLTESGFSRLHLFSKAKNIMKGERYRAVNVAQAETTGILKAKGVIEGRLSELP